MSSAIPGRYGWCDRRHAGTRTRSNPGLRRILGGGGCRATMRGPTIASSRKSAEGAGRGSGGDADMLFKCRPEGLPIPGRFPGPAHARGKWFTIDIHCHLLTPKAEEMVAAAGLSMDWQPRHRFANDKTREVNREQARRTRVQFTSIEKRLADMDRMGIDIQAITPSPAQTFYSVPADLGIATARVINDNIAEICGKYPDRFVGLGTVPFQAPELAVAELDRLAKSLGLRGIEIATNVAGADLSEPRFRPIFARAEDLGLTLFMHPTGFPEASRFRDHYFTNII